MWFKTSAANTVLFGYGEHAIEAGTSAGPLTPALYIGSDGKLRGQFWNGAVSPRKSVAAVNNNQWHHVALVDAGTSQTLYVDGKAQGDPLPGTVVKTNATYKYIGAGFLGFGWPDSTYTSRSPAAATYFTGQIAEVALYPGTLDAKQVEAQFKARDAVRATAVPTVTYSVQHPDQAVSRDVHDLQGGRKLAEINALGRETRFGYSSKGFLRTVTDPNGNMTINEHDVRGNVVSTSTCQDRSENKCSTSYFTYSPDATTERPGPSVMNDRLLTKRGPGSTSATDNTYLTRFTYNAANAVRTSEIDPLGRTTTVEYTNGSAGPSGLPTRILKPGGGVVSIGYNTAGDIVETTDPAGKTTRYEYDALGRTIKETEVVGSATRVTATYKHDAQDRVVEETGAAVTNHVSGAMHTPHTRVEYDDDGLPKSEIVSDLTGGDAPRSVIYEYDEYGRRKTETDARGKSVTLGYDVYGRVNAQTHADESVVRTTYDSMGNELEVKVDGELRSIKSMAYDPAGRLARMTDAMGVSTRYEYTDNNLLTKVNRHDPRAPSFAPPFVEEANQYDAAGNLVSQTTNGGLTTTTRTYDAAGRGLTATLDPSGLNRTTAHTYSPNDDVLTTTLTNNGTTVSRSEAMYDKLGRVLAETSYAATGLVPVFRWTFDEISNASTPDTAGNTRGTVTPGAVWSWDWAGSVALDGAGAAVTADQPVVDASRGYSFGLWANVSNQGTDRTVLSMPGTSGQPAMELRYLRSNAWQLTVNGRTGTGGTAALTVRTADGTVAPGSWTQLAVTVDPATGTAALYSNGTRVGSPATATDFVPLPAAGIRVGDPSATTPQGGVEDLMAFQKTLTAAEVMQVHQNPVAATQRVVRTSQSIDADGSVTSATDARGYPTRVLNDEAGRAAVITAPAVSTVTGEQQPVVAVSTSRVGYNTFGDVTEQQDANGNVAVMRYDAVGNLKETQLPNYVAPGSSTPIVAKATNEYNAVGQVESTTDPLGATTSFEYDRFGRTKKVTAPDGGVSTFEYTANGDLLSQTDPTGATATATYDFLGRTKTSTQVVRQTGEANTTTFEYLGSSPWPTSVVSPAAVTVKMGYNAAGEQNRLEDGAGNVTQTEFDGAGRPVKVTAPDLTYERATYDLAGRLVDAKAYSAAGAVLRTVSSGYDAAGNLIEATDARETKKTFAYDARGQLVSQTEPINGSDAIVSTFGYDPAGQRTRFTDGRGNRFVTSYNSWGLPESQIEPATSAHPGLADRTFTMSYDKAGRMVKMDSPGGVRVESEYNNMGRLKRNWGSGAQVATIDKSFEYDEAGRITSLTGSAGVTSVEYDDRGLPTTIGGVSGASSYTYKPDGALASRTDAAGTTSYTYDTAGRQKTVVNTGAGVNLTYAYNNMSLVSSITHGAGGNVRSFGYDDLHRTTSDELKTPGGASIAKIAYGWDRNDNLTSKRTTGFAGAAANTYTYDLADRLIGWDNGSTPVVYAYDKSGNRTQADGKTFQYDQRNQLLSSSDGTAYHYSARGTLTSTVQGGQTQATVTDAFNQVVRQTAPGGDVQTYTYDGLGRLIKPNLSYTGLSNTVAGDSTATYVRDAADGLVGVASGGTKRYAWTDLHTDVVGEFGGTGTALTGSVSYDPWGKVGASAGMIGKLGFQSQWTDEGTGRVNMWARWYDPETGAFDTRDPASNDPTPGSGAANRFAYAEGDPLGNTDTTGYGVDGKCGTYDYECELKKYQGQLAQYNRDLGQHQRDVKFTGDEIARQEADYQRAERESQTSLADILMQVGVGMLLDMIGYNSLMGCLEGSTWDCIDLASNLLGPIKFLKMAKSLYRAVDRAFSGYRTWRRIIDGARTMMNRAASLMNQARKHLSDLMQKVPKKPKPPKKKIKPPAKKKPKPKAKPKPKPKPSEPAKPPKPKAAPKKADKPDKERPNRPERERAPEREGAPEQQRAQDNNPEPACRTHSFDSGTRVLMADGSTRPISEVNVGDEVVTTDPKSGEHSDQQVTLLHANRDTELTDVTVSTEPPAADRAKREVGEGKGERSTRGPTESVLETTAYHPFWDATTGDWVDAAELIPDTSTLVGPDGQIQYVTAVRNFTGAKVMRDLTVATTHTYYVLAGDKPALVHNCGGGDVEGDARVVTNPATGREDSSWSNYDKAMNHVSEKVGDLGENVLLIYDYDPITRQGTGTLIGMQTVDKQRGWRVDNDKDTPHINWWNWTGGKKGAGGKQGHAWLPKDDLSVPGSRGIGDVPEWDTSGNIVGTWPGPGYNPGRRR
jgi:RHS repeat-associated protein